MDSERAPMDSWLPLTEAQRAAFEMLETSVLPQLANVARNAEALRLVPDVLEYAAAECRKAMGETRMDAIKSLLDRVKDLQAEIARLQARLARLAEVGTGYSQQTMDALVRERTGLQAEVERLHEALALTPEKVEAAAFAKYRRYHGMDERSALEQWNQLDPHIKKEYLDNAPCALIAAGMEAPDAA